MSAETSSVDDRFDLHVHSTRSDGCFSLLQLTEFARRSGLAGLAITDHDALPESRDLTAAGENAGIDLLSGAELSTRWCDRGLHLLAYGVDLDDERLRDTFRQLQAARRKRWQALLASARQQRLRLGEQAIHRAEQARSVGRVHFARALVEGRSAGTIRDAFWRHRELFSSMAPVGDLDIVAAIGKVHGAGGRAILAHPPRWLTTGDWQALWDAGLDGLEARFPKARPARQRELSRLARDAGKLATAGSDFHGDDTRHSLGRWTVDRVLVERLATMTVHGSA